ATTHVGAVPFPTRRSSDLAVTVNTAGLSIFGGRVGFSSALASLTTDYEGAGDQGTIINGDHVIATGRQLYQDDVQINVPSLTPLALNSSVTLQSTAGSDVRFDRTLTGVTPTNLTVNTSGQTIFNGVVTLNATGPLSSLTTDYQGGADEKTQISGGSVTTSGKQVYNDPVTVGQKDVTLASTQGGDVIFERTLDGGVAV